MKDSREYVSIAVDIASNDKLAGADPRAKWLHVVSIAAAGRDLSDGHVRARVVLAEAEVQPRFVADLLARGAWHGDGHDCPACPQPRIGHVYVHDFLEHNRSKEDVERIRGSKRYGASLTNHKRWHEDSPEPDCRWCRSSDRSSDQSSDRISDRSGDRSPVAPPVAQVVAHLSPETETEGSMAKEVRHLNGSGAIRDDLVDLETIARATRGDLAHAGRVARDVLSKARTQPTDPTAFVLTAVRADPTRHRSNAPTTRARCPEHDIDLPCGACAADRKAAR